jgi:hypothetical protein
VLTPGQVVSALGRVVSPPGQVVSRPGQVVSTPGQVVSALGRVVSPPGQVVSPPGQIVSPLGQAVPPLGQVVPPPGQVVSAPGQVVPTLRQVVPAPGEVVLPPGQPGPRGSAEASPADAVAPELCEVRPSRRAVPRMSVTLSQMRRQLAPFSRAPAVVVFRLLASLEEAARGGHPSSASLRYAKWQFRQRESRGGPNRRPPTNPRASEALLSPPRTNASASAASAVSAAASAATADCSVATRSPS